MIQWHVFISVPQHHNPYSGNFAKRASSPTWPTTDFNPYSANLAGCEGFGDASTHWSPLIELKLILRDFYLV